MSMQSITARLRPQALAVLAALTLGTGCVAPPEAAPGAEERSILRSSTPRDGSSVQGPLNRLELRFSPAARLGEVTVTGGDGTIMPIMVTAVGEVSSYDIPLPGLGPGVYRVSWKAMAAGASHEGSLRFTVR